MSWNSVIRYTRLKADTFISQTKCSSSQVLHSLTILYNTQPYRILKLNTFKMHINMNQATYENMITYHIKHKFGSYWLESRSINQQTNEINKKKTQILKQSQCFFCSICTKGRGKKIYRLQPFIKLKATNIGIWFGRVICLII